MISPVDRNIAKGTTCKLLTILKIPVHGLAVDGLCAIKWSFSELFGGGVSRVASFFYKQNSVVRVIYFWETERCFKKKKKRTS